MSEWQPIETAPKDGRSILCFIPLSGGCDRMLVLRWDDGKFLGEPAQWKTDVHSFVGFDPTHWMPLPTPPEQER